LAPDKNDYYREIAALSHVLTSDAKEFSEAQFLKMILDYIEKGEIQIPFLGTIKIKHVGDKLEKGKVVAKINTEFVPDESLIKSIGQHTDGLMTEAEELYKNKTRRLLKQLLKEV